MSGTAAGEAARALEATRAVLDGMPGSHSPQGAAAPSATDDPIPSVTMNAETNLRADTRPLSSTVHPHEMAPKKANSVLARLGPGASTRNCRARHGRRQRQSFRDRDGAVSCRFP